MNRKLIIIAALCSIIMLPAGKCSGNIDEIIGTVQAGIGLYQAAKLHNCDAIDAYADDIVDNVKRCKTKNLILDLQAGVESACNVAAMPNPPAGNMSKAGLIIDNTLAQVKANRLKC